MTDIRTSIFDSTPAPDPLIGRVINDRFKITALIARGGMGKVYRAEQAPLGRVCAVKVLNPNYDGDKDPEFPRRFFLEASIASKLTHPNTVTIFDYGRTDDDIYYMAMEYLEGRTLHRAIRQAGGFPEARAAHVGRQICRAMREAHAHGVIHRDLKPANVFLVEHGDETDFVKVLDFGLVKNVLEGMDEELTKTGLFMGSPKYMAPEQIRAGRVDARTDVYALGIVLFEMTAGRVPFDGPNTIKILTAHLNEVAPRVRQVNPHAQVSEAFEELVARCLSKDPNSRLASMDDVLVALRMVDGSTLTQSGETAISIVPAATSSARALSPMALPEESTPVVPLMSASPRAFRPMRAAVGAFLGAAAAAAIAGYAAFPPVARIPGRGQRDADPTPSVATLPSVASAAAGEVAQAKVRVSSVPGGAAVREDGVEVCGNTPCDIQYSGAEATPDREHRLTLSRQGFRVESRVVKVSDGAVDVRLTRVADAPRAAPQPLPRGESATQQSAGYRIDVPY